MKAWRHKTTLRLWDIQTIPNPLPIEYNATEWELVDISEAEITAIMQIAQYTHTQRGLSGLFEDTSTLFTHNMLEVFI